MNVLKKTEKYKNYIIKIFNIKNSPNTIKKKERYGYIHFFTKLGLKDDKLKIDLSKCNTFNEMKQYLIDNNDAFVVLPIYLLPESKLTTQIITGDEPFKFNITYNILQIGVIFATKTDVFYVMDAHKDNPTDAEGVTKRLQSEISEYSSYISNNVYFYKIYYNGKLLKELTSEIKYNLDINSIIDDAKKIIDIYDYI